MFSAGDLLKLAFHDLVKNDFGEKAGMPSFLWLFRIFIYHENRISLWQIT